MKKIIAPLLAGLCLACGNDPIPKPKAYLRLEYPEANYKTVNSALPFTFEKNELSNAITNIKVDERNQSYGIDIKYPSLKGTIYLTYKKVDNKNLIPLITDAQNITQKHTIKADGIEGDLYENPKHKVFGMFYEVDGNAASQAQFYATDSVNHFLNGALYFYAKPNFDSIYPAAEYLKKDIKHIMETLKWK